ncbi:hypothetical protein Tco_1346184 [Tanacetum coccineum]
MRKSAAQNGYDSRVNERLMQTTEEKVYSSKALDASLVIIESNGTESQEQDTSSRSGNDAHVDDADIRPIDNEEPMAELKVMLRKKLIDLKNHLHHSCTQWKQIGFFRLPTQQLESLPIYQMDGENAHFLMYTEVGVYVAQPEGSLIQIIRKSLPLRKALYDKNNFQEPDADIADALILGNSTSGGIQFLGDKLPYVGCDRNKTATAMSSAEGRVRAVISASLCYSNVDEVHNFRLLLHYNKIPLYCDTQTALAISCNHPYKFISGFWEWDKQAHPWTRYHFIKEQG